MEYTRGVYAINRIGEYCMGCVRIAENESLMPNTSITVLAAGTGTPSPSPTKKAPAFEFVLTIAILSVAYLLGRKRR